MKQLTVLILTFNEEIHIQRAIESARQIADDVIVIDSYSTDRTLSIASEMRAKILQNVFLNHATQLQWALDNSDIKSEWIMRIDADEYLTTELIAELKNKLPTLDESISGIIFKRQVHFMGQWIRHGGYYPISLMRAWRNGHADIEQRLMDEHMVLKQGKAIRFDHDIVDENLNTLTWWISKHNTYASREAVVLLNQKHQFLPGELHQTERRIVKQALVKRWLKNNLYVKLPLFLRAFLYFNYRYWIKLGFLDGRKGLIWHFLQGLWYRFLVDAKIFQIQWKAQKQGKSITQVIEEEFKIKTI